MQVDSIPHGLSSAEKLCFKSNTHQKTYSLRTTKKELDKLMVRTSEATKT